MQPTMISAGAVAAEGNRTDKSRQESAQGKTDGCDNRGQTSSAACPDTCSTFYISSCVACTENSSN